MHLVCSYTVFAAQYVFARVRTMFVRLLHDLDGVLTYEPLNHHKSWTDFCHSAKGGCQLCQAFVKCEALKVVHKPLPENFDENLDPASTQIYWYANMLPEMFILRQRKLFFPPYDEILNL